MSRTIEIINKYYDLLEYTIEPDKKEFYGRTMSVDDLRNKHHVVCNNKECDDFKDCDDVEPGEVVYIRDEDDDLTEIKVT